MRNNRDRKTKVSTVLIDFFFLLQNSLSVVEYHGNAVFQLSPIGLLILRLMQQILQRGSESCFLTANSHIAVGNLHHCYANLCYAMFRP